MEGKGKTVVSWVQQLNFSMLTGRKYPIHSSQTQEPAGQINVQMATLSDGNWVATWMDSTDGSEYGVCDQVFDQSGNRIGNEFLAVPIR